MATITAPEFTTDQEDVLFGLTLAWCEDVHSSVYSFTVEQCETAEALAEQIREDAASEDADPLLAVISIILDYYISDMGEDDLPEEYWSALEALHGRLSAPRGHTARRLDGTLI